MFDLGLEGFYCSPILDGKLFHFKPFLFQTKMLFLTLPFTDSSTASLLNVGILQVLYLTFFFSTYENKHYQNDGLET